MPNSERRNDIGHKMLISVISALLGVIMTITWFTARDAMAEAIQNKVNISVLQVRTDSFKEMLVEVRDDVKLIIRNNGYTINTS